MLEKSATSARPIHRRRRTPYRNRLALLRRSTLGAPDRDTAGSLSREAVVGLLPVFFGVNPDDGHIGRLVVQPMWWVVTAPKVARHANQNVDRGGPVVGGFGFGGGSRWCRRGMAGSGRNGAATTDRGHRGAFGEDVSTAGRCLRFSRVGGTVGGVVRGGLPADPGRAVDVVGVARTSRQTVVDCSDERGNGSGHGRGIRHQRIREAGGG